MTIGEKLNKRRSELNLSLQEVADYVGVTRTTVMRWEKGIIENVKSDKIQKLSEILLVSVDYILGNAEEVDDIIVARLKKQAIEKVELMSKDELEKLHELLKIVF